MPAPSRSYSAQDLVALPKLTATELVTLVTALTTAHAALVAGGAKIPDDLGALLSEVDAASVAVGGALTAARAPTDSAQQRAADHRVDVAWSITRDWLGAFCKLPPASIPAGADAYALYTALFGEGLQFLTLDFRSEWAESQLRLEAIDAGGYGKTFTELGGGAFLGELKAAHAAYGAALGVTTVPKVPAAASEATVGAALTAALTALREYVSPVAGSVRRKNPATKALADALLRPLTTWVSKPSAAGPVGAPGDPAPPAGGGPPVIAPKT